MNPSQYVYLGDRLTDPLLVGHYCTAVRQPNGKCIRGKNGTILVEFDDGLRVVVIARRLRKLKLARDD